jgi:hypothetical protein
MRKNEAEARAQYHHRHDWVPADYLVGRGRFLFVDKALRHHPKLRFGPWWTLYQLFA